MKKTVIALAVISLLAGCSGSDSSSSSKSGKDSTSYKDINGVENVNGNIPDTNATGATPHTDKLPKDSITTKAKIDSLHKKQ